MDFSQTANWAHRFKTWEQHFLNMTRRRRLMSMYWCRRAGKTYTAAYLILERMLRSPYFSVAVYNDPELMPMLRGIIQREAADRVSSFEDDGMIILDNGSYVFEAIGIVKADLLYVNNLNSLPERAATQLVEMYRVDAINELLVATIGGNDNLKILRKELPDFYIDFVDWRYIIDEIRGFWTKDEDWKHALIDEIGKEQFEKEYETKIDDEN